MPSANSLIASKCNALAPQGPLHVLRYSERVGASRSMPDDTCSRELRALGFRKISGEPFEPRHRGQNDVRTVEDFKASHFDAAQLEDIRSQVGTPPQYPICRALVGQQDEARVGQKTKLTRRWAPRGSRPMAPKDQRTKSACIFGAICPQRGVGAGLVLPRCNTQAMQWHLDEISSQVAPGAHAVLIIDRNRMATPTRQTRLRIRVNDHSC